MVLEFIRYVRVFHVFWPILNLDRLDARHTGDYLALKLHECLDKYNLSRFVSPLAGASYHNAHRLSVTSFGNGWCREL